MNLFGTIFLSYFSRLGLLQLVYKIVALRKKQWVEKFVTHFVSLIGFANYNEWAKNIQYLIRTKNTNEKFKEISFELV